MKKIILLLGIIVGSTHLVMSQLYLIAPNDTIETIVPQNQLTIVDIYQRNISGDTILLAWTKISEDIPAGWDYSLCDKGTCYPGFPLSGTMASVTAPDSGFLGVNVDPYSLPGTLTIRFYVYETSAPSAGDTLTWILTAQPTGIEDISYTDFNIYPNPSSDYIQVKLSNYVSASANLTIYDLNGRIILKRGMVQQNGRIDISSLSAGNYILEIEDKFIVRKIFMKK